VRLARVEDVEVERGGRCVDDVFAGGGDDALGEESFLTDDDVRGARRALLDLGDRFGRGQRTTL
jgi:hypothetical protein